MNDRIFVSIACLDDLDVVKTVDDLLNKADQPALIRAVIINQTNEPLKFSSLRGEVYTFPISWAAGVGKPRYHAVQQLRDETYYLQVDAHCRFQKSWDTILKDELLVHPNNTVLSALPPGFIIETEELLGSYNSIPTMDRFIESVPVSSFTPYTRKEKLQIPHIAAGLVFCKAEIIREVQPDPFYHYIGEEFSQTIRLWTNGYDCYAVRPCVLHHAYRGDNKRPSFDNVGNIIKHWRSTQRISALIGDEQRAISPNAIVDIEKFCLGKSRALKSWEERFGVNLLKRKFLDKQH